MRKVIHPTAEFLMIKLVSGCNFGGIIEYGYMA